MHMPALGADMREGVRPAETPLLADDAVAVRLGVVFVEKDIRAAEVGVAQRVAGGREPARTLPAIDGAEHGALRRHPVVAGRALEAARGTALLLRVVDGEDLGIGLFGLLPQVAPPGIGAEAARIDAHHVDRGLALDDPLGELPAGSPGGGDTEAMPLVEPEVAEVPGGPTMGLPSGV